MPIGKAKYENLPFPFDGELVSRGSGWYISERL